MEDPTTLAPLLAAGSFTSTLALAVLLLERVVAGQPAAASQQLPPAPALWHAASALADVTVSLVPVVLFGLAIELLLIDRDEVLRYFQIQQECVYL